MPTNQIDGADRPALAIEVTEEAVAEAARRIQLFNPEFSTAKEAAEELLFAALGRCGIEVRAGDLFHAENASEG